MPVNAKLIKLLGAARLTSKHHLFVTSHRDEVICFAGENEIDGHVFSSMVLYRWLESIGIAFDYPSGMEVRIFRLNRNGYKILAESN